MLAILPPTCSHQSVMLYWKNHLLCFVYFLFLVLMLLLFIGFQQPDYVHKVQIKSLSELKQDVCFVSYFVLVTSLLTFFKQPKTKLFSLIFSCSHGKMLRKTVRLVRKHAYEKSKTNMTWNSPHLKRTARNNQTCHPESPQARNIPTRTLCAKLSNVAI